MIIFRYCTKCGNTGKITSHGEEIPQDEISDREWAERLIEGTHFFRAIKENCPDLDRPKHK